jgi:septal ring factor EnvC (AmiA/AmiB activator)
MILACIVLTVTNVAAFWAWRLAEASLENEQSKSSMLSLGHSAIKRERDELNQRIDQWRDACHKMENNMKQTIANNIDFEATVARQIDEIHQLKNQLGAYELDTLTKSEWRKQIEGLQNEIDGLNVDKLYLKGKLAEFEAKQAKRREQKNAGMRRFRAKKKEAKG